MNLGYKDTNNYEIFQIYLDKFNYKTIGRITFR